MKKLSSQDPQKLSLRTRSSRMSQKMKMMTSDEDHEEMNEKHLVVTVQL